MTIEKVNFQNSNGKRLSAKLELPIDRRPLNFAVFAHCFTCNKNFNAVINDTIKPFLASKENSVEEVEAMYRVWCKAVMLYVTVWSRAYIAESDW
jgi:hypothetical protein